jgi:hypothetical protein
MWQCITLSSFHSSSFFCGNDTVQKRRAQYTKVHFEVPFVARLGKKLGENPRAKEDEQRLE